MDQVQQNGISAGEHALGILRQLWLIVSLFCIVVGLSGLIVIGLANTWGKSFIAGDKPGVVYTAERCSEFFQLIGRDNQDMSCTAAAVTHHYDEEVGSRLSIGVLGIIGLALWTVFVRKMKAPRLPRIVWTAAFLAVSGMLAIVGLGLGVMPVLFGFTNGAGDMLSIGLAFGASTLVFAIIFWRESLTLAARSEN